jgi:catalase
VELNRNPENYFAEVEQAAFNPAHVVPGISFSPGQNAAGRLFSYGDAQRYRLGINHQQIPVNAPKCPVHSYHRDGAMRVDGNHGGLLHTSQTATANGRSSPRLPNHLWPCTAPSTTGTDYYSQPAALFRLLNTGQKQVLFDNTARAMGDAPREVKMRHIANCTKVDPAYGKGVAMALKLPMS